MTQKYEWWDPRPDIESFERIISTLESRKKDHPKLEKTIKRAKQTLKMLQHQKKELGLE